MTRPASVMPGQKNVMMPRRIPSMPRTTSDHQPVASASLIAGPRLEVVQMACQSGGFLLAEDELILSQWQLSDEVSRPRMGEIEHQFIDVTPGPLLARLHRLHDRVLRLMKML